MHTRRAICLILMFICLPMVLHAQAQKVDLKLNLTQGQRFYLVLATSNSSSATVDNKPISTTESAKFPVRFTVAEITPEDNYRLQGVFESGAYSVTGNSPGLDVMTGILDKAFKALNGHKFDALLTRSGNVLNVTGLDSAIQAATLTVASMPEPARKVMEGFIAQGLSEANWRQGLSEVFSILPSAPVAIGERYTRKVSVNGEGVSVQAEAYYKILERANGIAKIKAYYDIKSLEKSLPIGVTYSMSGTQEGVLEVQESTGLLMKGSLKSSLKGKASDANTGGKSVPITVSGSTTMTIKLTGSSPGG